MIPMTSSRISSIQNTEAMKRRSTDHRGRLTRALNRARELVFARVLKPLFPLVRHTIDKALTIIGNIECPIRTSDQPCRATENLAVFQPSSSKIFDAGRLAVLKDNAHDFVADF